MSKFLLNDAKVVVAGKDLSDHAFNVDTPETKPQVDVSGFNPNLTMEYLPGLADQTITVQFRSDFAAGKVHATLQPLIGSNTAVPVEIRPVNGARSATNPAVLMQGLLMSYSALDGSVGDASSITAEFQNASQTGITYPTS